jgi:hypothetical protein
MMPGSAVDQALMILLLFASFVRTAHIVGKLAEPSWWMDCGLRLFHCPIWSKPVVVFVVACEGEPAICFS